ncbi:MAG: segregation/condensation protein A, partial [Clostridia bacterium]|nr:segregation/condensation protein A [Clostridia bacterium]
MEQSPAYDLKLENFEGPFDLLFHLIEKNEMDIYDIRISEITDQYLDYLLQMEKMDMDIASEFLVTASTLLHIKSRMLLPTIDEDEDEPIDPREELVMQLLEYRRCKASASMLRENHTNFRTYFFRSASKEDFGRTERTYSLAPSILKEMFSAIEQRNINKQNQQARYVNNLIRHEKFTVGRKLRQLVKVLFKKKDISFFEEFKKNGEH